jgi:predicted esterase
MKNLIFALCLLLQAQVQVWAQAPRKLQQDARFELKIEEPSVVITPALLDHSVKYPLVVFLPYTGGSAKDFYNIYNFQANEGGGMGYREFEVDLARLADSLKRMPTEDEVNRYAFLQELALNADRKEPTQNEEFTHFLSSVFGEEAKNKGFIALIPSGSGSTKDHSWEGFEACIFRYENRILKDIDSLTQKYNIDQSKIILAGFSLGGDLGWAISQRYPEKFKGAILSGTRCGYAEKGMMQRQAKQGAKYYISMGELESAARMTGAKGAMTLLNTAGIKHKFATIPQAEHEPATFEQFKEALNFILFE